MVRQKWKVCSNRCWKNGQVGAKQGRLQKENEITLNVKKYWGALNRQRENCERVKMRTCQPKTTRSAGRSADSKKTPSNKTLADASRNEGRQLKETERDGQQDAVRTKKSTAIHAPAAMPERKNTDHQGKVE